jgi:hypothetical protein
LAQVGKFPLQYDGLNEQYRCWERNRRQRALVVPPRFVLGLVALAFRFLLACKRAAREGSKE